MPRAEDLDTEEQDLDHGQTRPGQISNASPRRASPMLGWALAPIGAVLVIDVSLLARTQH